MALLNMKYCTRQSVGLLTMARSMRLSSLRFTKPLSTKTLRQNDMDSVNKFDLEQKLQSTIPFSRSKIGNFFQIKPSLGNQFLEDITLKSYLKNIMPREVYGDIESDLVRFGQRVGSELYDLHLECEQNPPRLQTYDAWGSRVDKIITCEAWKQMKKVAAEEGLIAAAYDGKYAEWSRLYQIAKLYLYTSSSGLYSCPLAMTDGAAKIIKTLGVPDGLRNAYDNLTTRDPDRFWTSGQWMTERKGGSDVAGGTETLAVPQTDGTYRLYGYKWFTSATDSDITMTLARVVDENGNFIQGSKGLSMFYAELRDGTGRLNNIEVQRLKDKLGTRQLPTAELLLDGTVAHRISEEGRGVAGISNMLTLTRIHNGLSSAAPMRRIINLARDYSWKRQAFGKIIKDHKLHIKNLANMEVEARASLLMVLEIGRLLGREETGTASKEESNILRIMTPLIKLYTAKQAMAVTSEGLECFGGMGYLEDTGLPGILRDAQVLPIWEGTTNILSLDMLRAIGKTNGAALTCLAQDIKQRMSQLENHGQLKEFAAKVANSTNLLLKFAAENTDLLEIAARDFAFSLSRTFAGALLLQHAALSGSRPQDVLAAQRWCEQDLTPVLTKASQKNYSSQVIRDEFDLVMDGYEPAE